MLCAAQKKWLKMLDGIRIIHTFVVYYYSNTPNTQVYDTSRKLKFQLCWNET